jgi:P pilus assembly chaperone PapD
MVSVWQLRILWIPCIIVAILVHATAYAFCFLIAGMACEIMLEQINVIVNDAVTKAIVSIENLRNDLSVPVLANRRVDSFQV